MKKRHHWAILTLLNLFRLTKGDYLMRFCFVMVLLLSAKFANPQQKEEEHTFPTKDQIQLLLTQSERAFGVYEQTVKQESDAGGELAKSATTDLQVLTGARTILVGLKKSPEGFNGPGGFLLVGGLDDASRNMSVCMGQAGMQSSTEAMSGNVSEGQRYLRLVQACLDASTLLYTVSETAYNMYTEYLFAEHEMMNKATSGLQECANILKKNPPQKR
jgi:hypothetical protein